MYYASFISLYWPYLQLSAFFAVSVGRSKLVLAPIKPLGLALFQQHRTSSSYISPGKAFKWNPVLTRFIITKGRDFHKKSRWYIEKRSYFHISNRPIVRRWMRLTKGCFPSLTSQSWCAPCSPHPAPSSSKLSRLNFKMFKMSQPHQSWEPEGSGQLAATTSPPNRSHFRLHALLPTSRSISSLHRCGSLRNPVTQCSTTPN